MNCDDNDETDSTCCCSEDIIGGLIGNVGEGVTLVVLSDVDLSSGGGSSVDAAVLVVHPFIAT